MSRTKQPILDPAYWRQRMERANHAHEAVFLCPLDQWQRIEAKHKEILARHIKFADSILDAGCAWGRLLNLLPCNWGGFYCGVDISPDFIHAAWKCYPGEVFHCGDIRNFHTSDGYKLDWAVLISIRPMIKRDLGNEVWDQCEAALRRVAKRLLYMEYDIADEGSVE